jgi:hypothetical protein
MYLLREFVMSIESIDEPRNTSTRIYKAIAFARPDGLQTLQFYGEHDSSSHADAGDAADGSHDVDRFSVRSILKRCGFQVSGAFANSARCQIGVYTDQWYEVSPNKLLHKMDHMDQKRLIFAVDSIIM